MHSVTSITVPSRSSPEAPRCAIWVASTQEVHCAPSLMSSLKRVEVAAWPCLDSSFLQPAGGRAGGRGGWRRVSAGAPGAGADQRINITVVHVQARGSPATCSLWVPSVAPEMIRPTAP